MNRSGSWTGGSADRVRKESESVAEDSLNKYVLIEDPPQKSKKNKNGQEHVMPMLLVRLN